MVDAGAPLTAVPMKDGELYLGFREHDVESALGQDPSGELSWAVLSQGGAPGAALAAVVAEHGPGYVLEVDGTDLSGEFEACHAEHPYTEPRYSSQWTPLEEAEVEWRHVPATRWWARCSRENGFPTVVDPPDPVADGRLSLVAILPLSSEPAELEDLFQVCPLYVSDVEVGEKLVTVEVESPMVAIESGGSLAGTPRSEYDNLLAKRDELMEICEKADQVGGDLAYSEP
jgi:hypothetical protein